MAVCTAHGARADDSSRVGFGVVLVDGVTGFTEPAMRSASGIGLLWGTRVTAGTKLPISLEVNYLGTEHEASIPGLWSGTLDGTAIDSAVRLSLLPHSTWSPYVFGGVGWERFDATAVMPAKTSDGAMMFPFGGGIQIRPAHAIIIDMRGTYRASRLLGLPNADGQLAPMSAWEATAAVGIEI